MKIYLIFGTLFTIGITVLSLIGIGHEEDNEIKKLFYNLTNYKFDLDYLSDLIDLACILSSMIMTYPFILLKMYIEKKKESE